MTDVVEQAIANATVQPAKKTNKFSDALRERARTSDKIISDVLLTLAEVVDDVDNAS